MSIIADTNVLIRAIVGDEPSQSPVADECLHRATAIAITLPTFCELAWTLRQRYRLTTRELHETISHLVLDPRVRCDRSAVASGLEMLSLGGDFADEVIAFEGRRLGGDVFATFDRKAARLIAREGHEVQLLQG